MTTAVAETDARNDRGSTRRRTRVRHAVLAVLFVSTAINYLDRTHLSVAAPHIQQDLGLSAGVHSSMPCLVALAGVLLGGWWSDRMPRWGFSANVARKTPIIAGLLLAMSIVAASYVDGIAPDVTIMSVAFFALGTAALG